MAVSRLALRRAIAVYGSLPLLALGGVVPFAALFHPGGAELGAVGALVVAAGIGWLVLAMTWARSRGRRCASVALWLVGIGHCALLLHTPLLMALSLAAAVTLQRAMVEGLVAARPEAVRRPRVEVVAGGALVLGAVRAASVGVGSWGPPTWYGEGLSLRGLLVGVGAFGALGLMLALERQRAHRRWVARVMLALALALVVWGVLLQRRWLRVSEPWPMDALLACGVLWFWSGPMVALVLVLLVREERA